VAVPSALLNELLNLPEAERVELALRLVESVRAASEADDLDDADRARLHEALERSDEQVRAGEVRLAADLVAELRQRSSSR
jgi:hypothetical protein